MFRSANVAPRVGAWIETDFDIAILRNICVAPRVGAWIETEWEILGVENCKVAPRVGAWIETCPCQNESLRSARRTPCGCVD